MHCLDLVAGREKAVQLKLMPEKGLSSPRLVGGYRAGVDGAAAAVALIT
jgi:hypothetical protein